MSRAQQRKVRRKFVKIGSPKGKPEFQVRISGPENRHLNKNLLRDTSNESLKNAYCKKLSAAKQRELGQSVMASDYPSISNTDRRIQSDFLKSFDELRNMNKASDYAVDKATIPFHVALENVSIGVAETTNMDHSGNAPIKL